MNKIFYIVFGVIAVASVAGLSAEFVNFDVQDYQFFGSFAEFDEAVCVCEGPDGSINQENCQQFTGEMGFMDSNGVCTLHPDVDLGDYGIPAALDEACGVDFWKSYAFESEVLSTWPAGYNPDDLYNDLFQVTIENENVNDEEQDDQVQCNVNTSPEFGGCTAEELAILNQQENDETEVQEEVSEETEVNDTDVDQVQCNVNTSPEFGGCTAEELAILNQQENDETEVQEEVSEETEVQEEVSEETEVQEEDGDTDNGPTLLEALNANDGMMNDLISASAAALLNSAHPEVSYQYSVEEVISMTQDAINNENYQDLIDIFEELNEEGVVPQLCEGVNINFNIP